MTDAPDDMPPLQELAFELKVHIGRDASFNNDFAVFIARCGNAASTRQLTLSLEFCRAATGRLEKLYQLISTLSGVEAEVMALYAAARAARDRGPSAAA